MLTTTVIENTNVVTATYDGSLAADDAEALHDRILAVASTHGAARLLVDLQGVDIGRIEPEAVWEDVKTFADLDEVDRLAVVTDSSWVRPVAERVDFVIKPDVDVFDADQHDEALAWVRD
jgi:hypothetical protein